VDAKVWVETAAKTRTGLCASYAVGTVGCVGRADIAQVEVERGLFITPGPGVDGIRTELPDYPLREVAGESVEALRQGLHERMTALEALVAREAGPADIVMVDRHLKERADIPRVVRYIKRHYVAHLNERQEILGRLKPRGYAT
jgi:hypothetical protein